MHSFLVFMFLSTNKQKINKYSTSPQKKFVTLIRLNYSIYFMFSKKKSKKNNHCFKDITIFILEVTGDVFEEETIF